MAEAQLANVTDRLIELGKKFKPDQMEAYASKNRVVTVRIAASKIVEAKEVQTLGHSVRFVKNKSVGFASTDGTQQLIDTIERASRAASSKDKDPHFSSLPKPKKIKPIENAYDKKLISIDLESAVELARAALNAAKKAKADFSGSLNIVAEDCAIRNTLGVDAFDTSTFAVMFVTLEREEKQTSVGTTGSRILKSFDPTAATLDAIEGLSKDARRAKVKEGSYKIIFGPKAMADLLELEIASAINAPAIESKFSYFSENFGKKVATPNFSLSDDGRHAQGVASKSVDDEGAPTQTTKIIEKGKLVGLISDSYYAAKLKKQISGIKATGNAFRFGSIPGRDYHLLPWPQATNLVVDPGNMTNDELIAQTKNGIYVGRIWYTYLINPTIGEFSTTNRGDTFLIKNGKLAAPIAPNSFRINDNIKRLLMNIGGISKEQKQSIIWAGVSASISPAILFNDVKVIAYK